MNGIKRRMIYGLLPMIMTALASCLLLSCFNEDDECPTTTTGSGRAAVQLHITTDGITDLNATRADEVTAVSTDNGDPGEFIDTLCIFIVDAKTGEIELKLQPDLSGTEADSGDLEDYTSDVVWLTTGEKTIYAFANWNNAGSDAWNSLISKNEGDYINATDLSFAISDPASKVDIDERKYIPMSGKLENVTIKDMNTYDSINGKAITNNLISVGLDRLVGKVTITVVGDEDYDAIVNSLFFEGTADNVALYPGDYSNITYGGSGKTVDSGEGITITTSEVEKNSTVKIATFYINESRRTQSSSQDENGENINANGFTIKLDMMRTGNYDKYDGTKYEAMTTTQDVPRNYIFPITINLDTYDIDLDVTAWTAPVDIDHELEYTSTWHANDDGYFQIILADVTSSFKLTPKLNCNSQDEEPTDVTWTWNYEGSDNELIPEYNSSDGILSVNGLTAMDYEYDFTLEVSWNTTSGTLTVKHTRTYNVQVLLRDGVDININGNSYKLKIKS